MDLRKAIEARSLLQAGKFKEVEIILTEILAEPSDFLGTYKMEVQLETQDHFKSILIKNDKLSTIKRVRDFLQEWISNNISLTTLKLTANQPVGPNFNECQGVFTFKTKSNFVKFFNHLVDNNMMIGKSFLVTEAKVTIDIPDPGMTMENWNSFCDEFHSLNEKKEKLKEQSVETRVGQRYTKKD